jgi:hypothetical protein
MPAWVLILHHVPTCDGGKAIVNQVRGLDNVLLSSLRAPARLEESHRKLHDWFGWPRTPVMTRGHPWKSRELVLVVGLMFTHERR